MRTSLLLALTAGTLAGASLLPAHAQILLPPLPAPTETGEAEEEPEKPMKPRGEAEQLLDASGFERPLVKGKAAVSKTVDVVAKTQGEWVALTPNAVAKAEGKLTAGLTPEIARTGKQSLYISFDGVKAPNAQIDLVSNLIPVKPNFTYRPAIYGRMDKKKPLTIDQRVPVIRLQVDFFQADKQTQAGETVFRIQSIPGVLNNGFVFNYQRWTEFFADVESPEDAAYIRMTYSWITPPTEGETSGLIYFDDAILYGERAEAAEMPETPEDAELTATGAPGTPASAAGASAPAPKGK